MDSKLVYDLVIIGGGFFGCSLANHLKKFKNINNVLIIEKEKKLMQRASKNNQARVHAGYHYPRNLITAERSSINQHTFFKQWNKAIKTNFKSLYAISKNRSKITSKQFEKLCSQINSELKPVGKEDLDLFNHNKIDKAYEVKEYVFDYKIIYDALESDLNKNKIIKMLNCEVKEVYKYKDLVKFNVISENISFKIFSKFSINCTYSGLNHFSGDFRFNKTKIKHELTELALVKLPKKIKNIGITIMDGPFFSLLPFPSENLHSLSHVKYTPHFQWIDKKNKNPYEILNSNNHISFFDRMIRDASLYVPILKEVKYVNSFYEIKTVLTKNEVDDGRPILFEKHNELNNFYSVLGGKIDNVYDIIEIFNNEFK